MTATEQALCNTLELCKIEILHLKEVIRLITDSHVSTDSAEKLIERIDEEIKKMEEL